MHAPAAPPPPGSATDNAQYSIAIYVYELLKSLAIKAIIMCNNINTNLDLTSYWSLNLSLCLMLADRLVLCSGICEAL